MLGIDEIKNTPNTINNIHESCFRSTQILWKTKQMIDRGDSLETIKEFIEYCDSFPTAEKTVYR